MNLCNLEWSKFLDYLIFERNYKNNATNIGSVKSRFDDIKFHFSTIDFNRENFREYLKILCQTKSNSTVNKYITIAKRIEQYLDMDIGLKRFAYRPEKPRDFEALTVEETEKIANLTIKYRAASDFLNLRNKILYLLPGINGGNRMTEALNLKWENVKNAPRPHVIFRDTKSRKDRRVYLSPKLWELIQQLPRTNSYVFTSYRNKSVDKPINPQEIRLDLQRRAKLCGIEKHVWYHLLRHSYATEMSENPDISPFDLADIMGYKSPETILERYKKSTLSHMAEVVMSHPAQRKDKPAEMIIKQLITALYRVIDPLVYPMDISHTKDGKLIIKIKGLPTEFLKQIKEIKKDS